MPSIFNCWLNGENRQEINWGKKIPFREILYH